MFNHCYFTVNFCLLPCSGSIFPSYKPSETIFKITFWLGYLNSCINPIIYPCFSQEFKKAFHNMLRGRSLRTGTPAAKQGPVSSHPCSLGPASNAPVTTIRNPPAASPWACCGMLSASPASAGDKKRARRKGLLKAWCLSARRTSGMQTPSMNGSAKVLQLSLGISGEAV